MNNNLYVVTPIFNPQRYKSRINLYKNFENYVNKSKAILITIEVAFGCRDFCVTSKYNPNHIQLVTNEEIWHKERMINLAIQRLPQDWKYVAWIDADITFARPDWVEETINLLQHYSVIQMFSQAIDLSPKNEFIKLHQGIMSSYENNTLIDKFGKYETFHPGFAWAATRDSLNSLGGLIDFAILGSADRHMALSLLEKGNNALPKNMSKGYVEQLQMWEDRCKKYIKKNVGHMPGILLHHWHGKKIDRKYKDRWKILIENKYDPEFDIKFDTQGLHQLTDRCPKLKYDIRKYFQSRNEDSIDL